MLRPDEKFYEPRYFFFFFFFLIWVIADWPHHYHPACGHKGSSHLSPVHALQILFWCKFSTLTTRQPMVEFYLLTFPRFPLRKKEHKLYFGKNRTHDFRTTSRCAGYTYIRPLGRRGLRIPHCANNDPSPWRVTHRPSHPSDGRKSLRAVLNICPGWRLLSQRLVWSPIYFSCAASSQLFTCFEIIMFLKRWCSTFQTLQQHSTNYVFWGIGWVLLLLLLLLWYCCTVVL